MMIAHVFLEYKFTGMMIAHVFLEYKFLLLKIEFCYL